ncbi:putative GPI anchor biosynthesis protein Gwt1 [Aspergillus clavatus NRRL 1]|uniref:GPI-anchored wall transfer protein n=1 Tax=Aspergillus clavatus (strain ATCC 1007 / CBS 513.65 / DSM 816 / NCTC 3887 / NRRL 1 / QM 1276 / 107) TaxID=344612 RepID=A1CNX1_ASPCL|nr:GPI anchor biosynthesis protein Gwt1, putative [Aspergillus clavatus NRRL 1]EAW07342.1 GPI anchor biosynthesis protein Gwt1, putative [Aspergillus clavatus NRRL 1]
MDSSYKARKEAFVSGLAGGTILEINSVTLVAPVSVFLWSVLQSRLSFFAPYSAAALVVDFLLNVLAILFATTLYSSAPLLLNLLLISPAILVLLNTKSRRIPQKAKPPRQSAIVEQDDSKHAQGSLEPLPIHPFLTTYRAAMMIITCIAILAVDFRVFPRRFAKVENWGTSLMDLGVGSFVFSGGVVSARSLLKNRIHGSRKIPLIQRLMASTRHSIPLLVLGLIRLYSVKGLDYAEHVTEYGVHWNFFFTLGFLPPFVEIFDALAVLIPSYELLSLGIAVLYQIALESTDLKSYILVSPRGPSLLSKNREGVFSFLGYLAIFLAGRAIGIRIIPRGTSPSRNPQQARKGVLMSLGIQALAWISLFALNSTYAMGYGANIPVSRRLANMPYVLWVAAFNNAQLFVFCLLETVFFPAAHRTTTKDGDSERVTFATSRIMLAFNKNSLAIFLLANLLTGAVNLSVSTLDASTAQAMAILIGYSSIITGTAVALDYANIKVLPF